MFFNYDILYSDGPMAIVWMAGNDEFSSKAIRPGKGRKGKLLIKLLGSDLISMCDLVRKQFPTMGTPNGLGLKKVAILVKGLGNIYLRKMDHLLQCMNEINLKIQIREKGSKRQKGKIDLPEQNNRTGVKRGNNLREEDILQEVVGNDMWGEMRLDEDSEMFGIDQLGLDIPLRLRHPEEAPQLEQFQRVVESPERSERERNEEQGRKKRRAAGQAIDDDDEDVFNEDAVMSKLDTYLRGISTTANCLRDDDLPRIPTSITEGENEFGDIDYIFDGNADQLEMLTIRQETVAPQSPGARGNENNGALMGDVEMDVDIEVEGVPAAAAAGVAGGEGRRMPDPQALEMQFEEVSQDSNSPYNLRRGRARRRPLKLIIDEEIVIPSDVMQANIRLQKRPNDYDELTEILAQNRAVIYKVPSWNMNGLNFIKGAGRTMGRQLSEFVAENTRKIRVVDLPQPRILESQSQMEQSQAVGEAEQIRAGASTMRDQSSRAVGADGTALGGGDSIQPSQLEIGNKTGFVQESEELFPTEAFLQDVDVDLGLDGVAGQDGNQENAVPAALNETLLGTPQININEGETLFKSMFPPSTTSRKQAATAFFQLLRLKKSGKVDLKQEHPFGDLIVKKMQY